jgi:outer membrane immunogenic protein
MEKTLIAASFAALLSMGGAASAADIYSGGSTKDAPAYAPVASWTGFYAGVNGGYAWGNDGKLSAEACKYCYWYGPYDEGKKTLSPEGGFGGGQIGYNWQGVLHPHFVFGIEADIQGGDITGSSSLKLLHGHAAASAKSELDWFGTVRGRLGYAIDNVLFYGTGGFAYGSVKDTLSVTPPWGNAKSAKKDETETGYVVGGGVEYKFNPSWSLKAEYQFLDFGSDKLSKDAGNCYSWATASLKSDHSYNTVRAGLNYHFGNTYEPLK